LSPVQLEFGALGNRFRVAIRRTMVNPTNGRVYGVAGLSVIDASIMPAVPRANTNIPAIMLAGKMAAQILARAIFLSRAAGVAIGSRRASSSCPVNA
jgi:choline dehydrogenase-like flavoprotein